MIKSLAIKAYVKTRFFLNDVIKNEKGDTNFISILIILGIVILVAGIFMGFKDQIVGQVQEIVGKFQIDSTTPAA